MPSEILIALALFLFVTAAVYTSYLGLYGSRTQLDDKLDDLAVKIRMADSEFVEQDVEPKGLGRMLLYWASQRLPELQLDTPKGEKLVQTLVRAGYAGPNAVRIFQAARLVAIAAFGALGLGFGVYRELGMGAIFM